MKKAIILVVALCFAIAGHGQAIIFDQPNATIIQVDSAMDFEISFSIIPPVLTDDYIVSFSNTPIGTAGLGTHFTLNNNTLETSGANGNKGVIKLHIMVPVDIAIHPVRTFQLTITATNKHNKKLVYHKVSPIYNLHYTGLGVGVVAPALNDLLKSFNACLDAEEGMYDQSKHRENYIAVQPAVLDSNLNLVFANVIFGSNGAAQNGTAATISSDKEKTAVSFTATMPHQLKALGKPHLNATIAAGASNSVFNFFVKDKFYSSATGGIGATWIFKGGQDKNPTEATKMQEERKKLFFSIANDFANMVKLQGKEGKIRADLAKAEADLTTLKAALLAGRASATDPDKLLKAVDALNLQLDSIDKVKTLLTKTYTTLNIDSAINYIRRRYGAFDYDHNTALAGYHISWLDAKANFTNYAFEISGDSLPKMLRNSLTIKNTFDFQFSLAYSRSASTKSRLWFFNFAATIERASYLNNTGLGLTGKPYALYDTTSGKYNLFSSDDDGNRSLGEYKDIHHECWYISPSIYLACFFGESKFIGFQAQADYHQTLTSIPGVYQPNSFNVQIGPVIRIADATDASKATIGLKAGFVNAIPNTHVWDKSFGVKLEVGVPFKWYEKKEKDK